MRIYTKTGDQGDTGLYGGERVPKDHHRVEAYGTVDELNAMLGQARALGLAPDLDATLAEIQAKLFVLGSDLATPASRGRRPTSVSGAEVEWLEQRIDAGEQELPALTHFILPAGSPAAAALHTCRAVCRRAERRVVTLARIEPDTSPLTVVFLNRLSDLLFVLARLANHRAGKGDVLWQAPSPT